MSALLRGSADCFAREVERDQVADSYLFVGPSRNRLRRIATACASRLLDGKDDPSAHPDFVVFDPEDLGVRALRVEHVTPRKEGVLSLAEALRYRPVEGGRRAVLLIDADRMGPDAQAALLKTVEEPPAGTVLFLTAADLGPILPALRSRCRVYRVGPPPTEELDRRAAEAGIDQGAWAILQAATGAGEAALDLSAAERDQLIDIHAGFAAWLAGNGGAADWLRCPEGNLADQRSVGARDLAACLGWLAQAYPAATPGRCLALDRVAGLLVEAMGDLRRQITPAVVFEDLAFRVDESPGPA